MPAGEHETKLVWDETRGEKKIKMRKIFFFILDNNNFLFHSHMFDIISCSNVAIISKHGAYFSVLILISSWHYLASLWYNFHSMSVSTKATIQQNEAEMSKRNVECVKNISFTLPLPQSNTPLDTLYVLCSPAISFWPSKICRLCLITFVTLDIPHSTHTRHTQPSPPFLLLTAPAADKTFNIEQLKILRQKVCFFVCAFP